MKMTNNEFDLDLDALELTPIADFDNETSTYVTRLLAKRAIAASKVGRIDDEHRFTPERDSVFQRMLSAVTGFFKPNQKRYGGQDVYPGVHWQAAQPVTEQEQDTTVAIRSKQQLRTLYHLLHAGPAGVPISDLQHLVGSGNQWDTVARLNQNVGQQIVQTTEYLVVNKTGKVTRRANYWLSAEGMRIAPQILANSKYVHDAASEGRHLKCLGNVACEFVASSSLDDDDLLVLRDGTMPQWLRLLYMLRAVNGQWVPRYVADELLDSRNVRQVVRVANKKVGGAAIASTTSNMPNHDGGVCDYGLYRLADGWVDQVEKLIKDKLRSVNKVVK